MKQVAQNYKTGELSVLDVPAPGRRPGVLVGAVATYSKVVNRLGSCTPKETLDAAADGRGARLENVLKASGRPEPV